MKKILLSSALLMSLATLSFAGTPKGETKDAKSIPAETQSETGAVVKWFHFNGDASDPVQVADPTNYSTESSPECSSQTDTYRCDIQILSNAVGTQPDLSQPVLAERKRATEQDK